MNSSIFLNKLKHKLLHELRFHLGTWALFLTKLPLMLFMLYFGVLCINLRLAFDASVLTGLWIISFALIVFLIFSRLGDILAVEEEKREQKLVECQ